MKTRFALPALILFLGASFGAAAEEAALPKSVSQEAAPQEAVSQKAAPQAAAPQEAAPQEAAPQEAAPQEAAPQEAAPQEAAPQETAQQQPAPPPKGSVARAAFTTAVEHHEPVDNLDKLPADTDKVYFFTDLRRLKGQTVTHVWSYRGEVMAEVTFDVRGPRWRVYSSKNLQPSWTGQWTVKVVDAQGRELASKNLMVEEAAAADEPKDSGMADTAMTEGSTTEQSATQAPATEEPAATTEDAPAPATETPAETTEDTPAAKPAQ